MRVSETKLTVRHFDVTNMSRYVTPRGSSWLLAPFASPRAVSGTRPRPPPAQDAKRTACIMPAPVATYK